MWFKPLTGEDLKSAFVVRTQQKQREQQAERGAGHLHVQQQGLTILIMNTEIRAPATDLPGAGPGLCIVVVQLTRDLLFPLKLSADRMVRNANRTRPMRPRSTRCFQDRLVLWEKPPTETPHSQLGGHPFKECAYW